ncbi:hypothetical protein HOY80DRAFT_1000490 [Tuber brumale]|nr:hypothetical protein HOY80DRAFT_1000490 [Tuber brumale]
MIPITTDKDICIWLSITQPCEAMDVLFCGHSDAGEDAAHALANHPFGYCDNRGPPDDPLSSDESSGDDGPGPSSAPAKRMGPMSKSSQPTKKSTAGAQRRSPCKVSNVKPCPDTVSDNAGNLTSDEISALPFSPPPPPMPEESSWTAFNDAGRRPLLAIAEADELNHLANPGEPLRKVIRQLPVMGTTMEPESERTNSEVHPSLPASDRLTVPNSPSPLTPNSHDLHTMVSEQAEVVESAAPFITIAAGS